MSAEVNFKARIVQMILDGDAEKALNELSDHYSVIAPKLHVGLPRGHRIGTLGCYAPGDSTISVLNGETLRNPFVIIHEFYHHLRTDIERKHLGNERKANEFAQSFLQAHASN